MDVVQLREDMNFVTGQPNDVSKAAFTFNLAGAIIGDITNITFNNAANALFTVVALPGNAPYGTFLLGIDFTNVNCRNGAPGATLDPLRFTALNAPRRTSLISGTGGHRCILRCGRDLSGHAARWSGQLQWVHRFDRGHSAGSSRRQGSGARHSRAFGPRPGEA